MIKFIKTIPKLVAMRIGAISCVVDGACTYPLLDYGACTYPLLASGAYTLPIMHNLVSCLYIRKKYIKITEGISVTYMSAMTLMVS
jgi:hypothetical protein